MKRIWGFFFIIIGFVLLYYCVNEVNMMTSNFSLWGILVRIGAMAGAGIFTVGLYTAVSNEWPWRVHGQ